ncbi:ATP-binding protein [Streptomyces sp. DT193]|uniref:ATP-binding protein n=1 Tax=Streptomyces sp. DT193 TaxID=3393418 RepID=UPI003CF3D3C6
MHDGLNQGRIATDRLRQVPAGGHADRTWEKRMRELVRPDVLILDDFATRQLTTAQADDLYELVSERQGRSLAIISNTDRAMVMLLDDEADPGEHALSPGASSSSSGFVLANGQHDEYPDEDTVLLAEAMRIVTHILTTGAPPADAAWAIDR